MKRADRRRMWVVLGAVLVFCVALFSLLQILFAHSAAYRSGLEALTGNPAVIQALGSPIKPGFIANGRINQSNDRGSAVMDIPVSGPRASGTAHVEAFKTDRGWQLSQIRLTLSSGATIQVLDAKAPAGEGAEQ
jgi:hypothetical protein